MERAIIREATLLSAATLWYTGQQQKGLERRTCLAHPIVHTYEEARHVVEDLGILPLSSCMPGHPSLGSITEPAAWHTGTDTDPWLWRDRFAEEGAAAYGRFLGDKPVLNFRKRIDQYLNWIGVRER